MNDLDQAQTSTPTPLRDPVCGMRLDPDQPGPSRVWNGRTIRFCSERCKTEFSNDPARYSSGG